MMKINDVTDELCMNWQPIETAPRGEDILLYFNFKGTPERKAIKEVVKGHFYPSVLWGDCWEYDGEYTVCLKDNVITHWMPLPKPPVNTTEALDD